MDYLVHWYSLPSHLYMFKVICSYLNTNLPTYKWKEGRYECLGRVISPIHSTSREVLITTDNYHEP